LRGGFRQDLWQALCSNEPLCWQAEKSPAGWRADKPSARRRAESGGVSRSVLTSCLVKPGDVLKAAKGSVLTFTYMRVQIDRFEDNGWAVLLHYPDGQRSFDAPRELLPGGASAGDIFEVRFEHDRAETERLAEENRRLMDELLGDER
jgi:hypothetical protein